MLGFTSIFMPLKEEETQIFADCLNLRKVAFHLKNMLIAEITDPFIDHK